MLWYQGESNLDSFQVWPLSQGAVNYACQFPVAISDWRLKLGAPMLPFYYVELAAVGGGYDDAAVTWPCMRMAMRAALALPHVSFVSALDLGECPPFSGSYCACTCTCTCTCTTMAMHMHMHVAAGTAAGYPGNVHSPHKRAEGARLAELMSQELFHDATSSATSSATSFKPRTKWRQVVGPLLDSKVVSAGDAVELGFVNAVGLHAAPAAAYMHVGSGRGCAESPFELGLANGSWVRAESAIAGSKVTLRIPTGLAAMHVTEVRYAWEPFVQCVLYAGAGGWQNESAVPAAPFRVSLDDASCALTQTRCSTAAVGLSAAEQAQCCHHATEVCVYNGGCQLRPSAAAVSVPVPCGAGYPAAGGEPCATQLAQEMCEPKSVCGIVQGAQMSFARSWTSFARSWMSFVSV